MQFGESLRIIISGFSFFMFRTFFQVLQASPTHLLRQVIFGLWQWKSSSICSGRSWSGSFQTGENLLESRACSSPAAVAFASWLLLFRRRRGISLTSHRPVWMPSCWEWCWRSFVMMQFLIGSSRLRNGSCYLELRRLLRWPTGGAKHGEDRIAAWRYGFPW